MAGEAVLGILRLDLGGVEAQTLAVLGAGAGLLEGEELGHPFRARGADAAGRVAPEAHALGPLRHLAVEEGDEADAVEGRLVRHLDAQNIEEGGIDVRGVAGHVGNPGLGDAGGPLEDGGHPQPALVDAALSRAAAGGLHVEPAVVATVPEDGVLSDAEPRQFGAELAEGGVHPRDLAVEVLLLRGLAGVELAELLGRPMGAVGRAEPHDRQERLRPPRVLADELEGFLGERGDAALARQVVAYQGYIMDTDTM